MTDWRKRLLWQIPLLALVCFIAKGVSENFQEELGRFLPETYSNCSSFNSKASGYKAFYELQERLGKKCKRFVQSYRTLVDESGVLIVIAPTKPMMPFEIDRVLDWVARGNRLVYLDHCTFGSGTYLLSKLKLDSGVSSALEDLQVKELPDLPEMEHVNQLVLSSETRLRLPASESKNLEKLISDKQGEPLLIRVKHGKGSCLIGTLPSLCSNRRISDKQSWGNFQFLCNCLAQDINVVFDERVHGYTSAQNALVYLARGPAGGIFLQGLLIFGLLLISLNQRFGPARVVSNPRKIASSEYIDGMAHTYMKARAHDTALAILYGSFHVRLCKALSLAPNESVETIAQSWSQSTKLSYDETLRFLQDSESFQNSRNTSKEQLLSVMKECDRLYEATKPYLAVQPGRRLGG